jgi:putative SOS response-associated peptidase YedK
VKCCKSGPERFVKKPPEPPRKLTNPATHRLAIKRKFKSRLSQRRCHVPLDIAGHASWDWRGGIGPSGFRAFTVIARSFFVQGAATIAIESNTLEAAR